MRWIALMAIAGLLLGAGLAYADTASAGTFASFSGVAWGGVTVSDPLNDDVDGPGSFDGRDIYQGVWWVRGATYDYFRMDLAGAPHDTQYDWAVVYGIYMDGVGAAGASGASDSYVPVELTGIDFIVDWHPDVASVPDDALLNPGTGGNAFHWHVWNQGGGTWSTSALTSFDYWVSFDDVTETAGKNTIQWRIPLASLPSTYDFTGATHDLASSTPTTFDLTEPPYRTPEPATMALMGLGLAGLAAIRRRKQAD